MPNVSFCIKTNKKNKAVREIKLQSLTLLQCRLDAAALYALFFS